MSALPSSEPSSKPSDSSSSAPSDFICASSNDCPQSYIFSACSSFDCIENECKPQDGYCNCDTICVAEHNENEDTCLSDCGERLELATIINGTNGSHGVMFDVRAINMIQILGFDIHMQGGGKFFTVEVYTKVGTYKGFETNTTRAAWDRIQTAIGIESKGEGSLTPLPLLSNPIVIPARVRQAFYIRLSANGLYYTAGDSEGSLHVSNENLELYTGIGLVDLFGPSASPRIWNGIITYVVVSEAPSEMPSDVPSAEPSLSSAPSGARSSEPSLSLAPSSMPSTTPSSIPSKEPSGAPSTTEMEITRVVLVDATTNLDVPGGFNCTPVCMDGVLLFNVRAEATENVQSVLLSLAGPVTQKPRVENFRPFSLFGDREGDYVGAALPTGTYTMTAVPYSLPKSGGTTGTATIMEFVVASPIEPSNQPSLIPSQEPSIEPSLSLSPTVEPSVVPSKSLEPSEKPSRIPSSGKPSNEPSGALSQNSSNEPSLEPSIEPSQKPMGPGTWMNITYDDFENGWGSFTTKGGSRDAARITASNSNQQHYVHQGDAALRIRDNSGTASSVFHARGHDVTGYSNLRVEFWFSPRSIEGSENFVLEYSSDDGSTWTTVKDYVHGVDFENESFYEESVDFNKAFALNGGSFDLTQKAKICFRCDASGKFDYIYIDEVAFQGLK